MSSQLITTIDGRFASVLREQIADTLESLDEIDAEVRYLQRVIRDSRASL